MDFIRPEWGLVWTTRDDFKAKSFTAVKGTHGAPEKFSFFIDKMNLKIFLDTLSTLIIKILKAFLGLVSTLTMKNFENLYWGAWKP